MSLSAILLSVFCSILVVGTIFTIIENRQNRLHKMAGLA
jgi:hypothetical protein